MTISHDSATMRDAPRSSAYHPTAGHFALENNGYVMRFVFDRSLSSGAQGSWKIADEAGTQGQNSASGNNIA